MAMHPVGDAEAWHRARTLGWDAWGWLFVMTAIGVVQLVRQQWGDALIFGVTAATLAADASGLLRLEGTARRPSPRTLLVIGGVLAVPLLVLPRHSVAMAVVVLGIGIASVTAAWPGRATAVGPWSRALRGLAISWAVIWIAAGLWELSQVLLGTYLEGGRTAFPALSDLVDPLLDDLPGRIVFVAGWLAAGVFLLRRGERR